MKKLKYPKLSSRLLIKRALAEDAPHGDITSRATIPPRAKCKARAIAKQEMTLAGIDLFADVFHALDTNVKIKKLFKDGELVPKGAIIATIQGKTRAILTAERVALNYLQRLSGIATLTKKFVDAVAGTKTVILDTRKTTPGLRDLEKYAVLCGGGQNHRRDLSEMALIKENHVTSAGGIAEAVSRIRKKYKTKIEVETRNLKEVAEALQAGADRIMLDNMTPAQAKRAVAQIAGLAETEASGNMNLKTVRKYAETGVDFISIGALTHSPPSADISLLLDAK
ncbi:Quinolinate phosphoribosyltransferase [decarboxylating] [hydrothermal vent metagenome]|uniref:Probable nicotinate-nucleotide pyrophosphorylase [carboxylating] n=1 Tax=hydrothermal vent metagenome TaxID=652676 RepID=A0A3B1CH10_9ZZZZ